MTCRHLDSPQASLLLVYLIPERMVKHFCSLSLCRVTCFILESHTFCNPSFLLPVKGWFILALFNFCTELRSIDLELNCIVNIIYEWNILNEMGCSLTLGFDHELVLLSQ